MGKIRIKVYVECDTCGGTGEVMIDGRPGHNSTCPTCRGACVVWNGDYEEVGDDDEND